MNLRIELSSNDDVGWSDILGLHRQYRVLVSLGWVGAEVEDRGQAKVFGVHEQMVGELFSDAAHEQVLEVARHACDIVLVVVLVHRAYRRVADQRAGPQRIFHQVFFFAQSVDDLAVRLVNEHLDIYARDVNYLRLMIEQTAFKHEASFGQEQELAAVGMQVAVQGAEPADPRAEGLVFELGRHASYKAVDEDAF